MSKRKHRVSLAKNNTPARIAPNEKTRARPSNIIVKQYKRQVSWQIADIKQAEMMASNPDTPDRRRLHEIYMYIMKDMRLISARRDAIMKITGEPWMLYNKDQKADDKLSNDYRQAWFNAIIKGAAEYEFYGYSVLECDNIEPKKVSIGVVKTLDRMYVGIENQRILIDGQAAGSFLDYGGIAWDLDLLEFVKDRDDLGLLLPCAYNIIWKYYSRSDWSRASEKFGMPLLSIEADTNNDNELDAIEDKAANFGTDGYIVTQKGDVAEIIERSGQRLHDIYLDNIKLCNEEVTIGVNGQTGTTDNKAWTGASQTQERKFEDITLDRLQSVADMMNAITIPYLRYKGFAIPEDYYFDYPALVREREKKINGESLHTSGGDLEGDNPTDDQPEAETPNPKKPFPRKKKPLK